MRTIFRTAGLPALMLLAPILGGCGYHAGFLIPAGVRTINVQVASNETFWREAVKVDNLDTAAPPAAPPPAYPMVVDLTERIKNEIVRRTPLKLAREKQADSILKTTITRVRNRVTSRDGADNVSAGKADIQVSFVWIDRRSGRVLAQESDVSRATTYRLRQRESFTTASRRSFDYVAEQIVEAMQEGF